MKIIIRTKNFKLEAKAEGYINKKIKGLEKLLKLCHANEEWEKIKSSCEIFVEIGKETRHHKKGCIFRARAKVHLPGRTIESDVIGENIIQAVDALKEEFLMEIKKYKSKTIDKNRKEQRRFKKELKETI